MQFIRGYTFDALDSAADLQYLGGVDSASVAMTASVPNGVTGQSLHIASGGHARFALPDDQAGNTIIDALDVKFLASAGNGVLLGFGKNDTAAAGARQAALIVGGDNTFRFFVGAAQVAAGTFVVNTTNFMRLDIRYLCAPSGGIFRLYINGNSLPDIDYTGNTQGADIAQPGNADNSVQAFTLGFDGNNDYIEAYVYRALLANDGGDANVRFPRYIGHRAVYPNVDGALVWPTSTGANIYSQINAPLGAPNDASYAQATAPGKNIVGCDALGANPQDIIAVQLHTRFVVEGSGITATLKTGIKVGADENQSGVITPALNQIIDRIDVFQYKTGTTPFAAGDDVMELTLDLLTLTLPGAARGYAMGGFTGHSIAEIDGIQFSDETAINPAAVLSVARRDAAGASSSVRGYAMGGGNDNNTKFTTIDGIQFSSETAINPAAVLSVARLSVAGTSSSVRGYAMGGSTDTYTIKIDGIQFSDETAINLAAVLSLARTMPCGVNSDVCGYAMGGYALGNKTEIDGIQFSSETAINPAAVLSVARAGAAGASSSVRGYAMGGYSGTGITTIDGIQFSSETAINPAAVLSLARHSASGVSSSARGYAMGGYSDAPTTEIDGIQFSDETAINLAAALSLARYSFAGVQG